MLAICMAHLKNEVDLKMADTATSFYHPETRRTTAAPMEMARKYALMAGLFLVLGNHGAGQPGGGVPGGCAQSDVVWAGTTY